MAIKGTQSKQPAAAEMSSLATLFNQGALDDAEKLALKITQNYPEHGFGWKVLGAIYQSRNLLDKAFHALKKAAALLPHDYEAQYNLANFHYDQNQLDQAIPSYKKAIHLNPDFVQAHYNLGNAYKSQGLLPEAETSYKKALLLDAGNASICSNLAHVLYEQNKLSEARSYYEQALKITPDFSAAHVGLGVVLRALDSLPAAEVHFRQAIKLDGNVEAYRHLGELLQVTSGLPDAEMCFREAVLAHPDSVDALVRMAIFLRTQGRVPESISYFNQALKIDPTRKDVHVDLGLAKAESGHFFEAESHYREAIRLDPDYWLAYNNLGLVLHRMERYAEAESAFNKAIELHPEEALLHSNLGLTLAAMGQIKKAEISLHKSIEIHPAYVNAHINLCTNYIAQGRLDEAEAECFEALKYDPDSNKARSNLLFLMNYSGHHSAEYRLQQAREFDRVVTKKVEHAFATWQSTPDKKRLRIGLMSGDLRQHPVAYFLENWVKNVDFSKFELYAYLTDTREDMFTGRIKPNFSYWKSLVGITDQAAAEMIHDDGVDILFDLSGHTSGNRLQILAWKPAPIQVSWLGYFATTGMKAVDYFIADEVGVPESHQAHFVEKVKYLPDTRLCFTAPHVAVEVSSLPALTNGYITFASFQTLAKAGDQVLALWAEVMLSVPHSKLRWQCKSLADADVMADMTAKFAKFGISADRLILLGSVSREAYFLAHHEVDVILDTFPYPGGTTTCEALWMGVPTLTLAGDSLIARQGASMLTAAGLADWIAETKSDYLKKALLLCSDLSRLAQLRANLRAKVLASPLFDAARFARNMEAAIDEMWHDHFQVSASDKHTHGSAVLPNQVTERQPLNGDKNRCVQVVSATRYSEQDFWSKSALGLSLPRHQKQNQYLTVNVAFNNTQGLSDVFNRAIEQAGDDVILVFVHDDVWLDEANLVDTLIAALEHYDVVGIAGNKRRLPNQPAWLFVDTAMHWDEPEYLSGTVSHGPHAFGEDKFYGDAPAACELLDGVLIATRKSALNVAHVRFDPQFDFHLYDVDFCRSARAAGLSIGTWPIKITHQSEGAFGSPHWAQKCQLYFNKWESNTPQQQALHDAMNEVMQMALQHETEGQLEQAAMLYQEVLKIQPDNAEANYKLGIVAFNLHGVSEALPLLEKAVQCEPENEQYWVAYIDALMQSADAATVLEALELGQKFGLTAETAQALAEEFLERNAPQEQPDATSPLYSNEQIKQCLIEMLTTNLAEIGAHDGSDNKGSLLKSDISPYLDLSAFEAIVSALNSAHHQDELIALIYKVISAIKLQKEFVGIKVFTPYFDRVLEAVDLEISSVIPRDHKLANVVVASEIYDYGGHTKVIQEILESVENPMLIVTDVYNRCEKNHLFEKVASAFHCPVMILPNEAYLDKAKRLADFINSSAKNVFILTHHEDAVAIAACQKKIDTRYYFVHHADHNPALGNTVSHFNHVDLFEPMAKLCAQDLNKPVTFLPTSSRDFGEKTFTYPIQGFATVTAGSAGKFAMDGELSLSGIVLTSLKTCGGKHYHFGDLSAEQEQVVRDGLTKASMDPALFVYLGNVPSLWEGLLTIDAHIFLGSAPTPGGKSNLEAAGAAYPLLAYIPVDAPRYLYVGAEAQVGLTWSTLEELVLGLRKVMGEHVKLSQQSRQFYVSNCSSDTFKQRLMQLCNEN